MIEIRHVSADEWELVRGVRLAALRDTPDWFWATYEEEVHKDEATWRAFIDAGAWFIAEADGRPVGIAAGVEPWRPDESALHLISMWVEPDARGAGIGTRLVETVIDWARTEGAAELQLDVTETNRAAWALYERCGFKTTGVTQPLPRKPALIEHEMRLRL